MNSNQEEVSKQDKGQDELKEYLPIPHVICRKWASQGSSLPNTILQDQPSRFSRMISKCLLFLRSLFSK